VTERHHTRFWPSGFSWQGQPVWVATASFDNSLRYLVAHSISPDIDRERDYIKAALDRTGLVADDTQVQLITPFSGANPVGNPFFTDGRAYVIVLRQAAS
jgi:undecaprenyl-diphosphatase